MKLEQAERLFEASLTELEATGMPAKAAQFVADGRARAAAEDEVKRVAEAGGWFLTREDEGYPERLKEIYEPAAGALGARGCRAAEQAVDCGGWNAASDAVWVGDCGDAFAGPGGAKVTDCKRDGAGN